MMMVMVGRVIGLFQRGKEGVPSLASLWEMRHPQLRAEAHGILNGFEHIETVTQSRWNYLNFIFYLGRKDPVEFSGPESRIAGQSRSGTFCLRDSARESGPDAV